MSCEHKCDCLTEGKDQKKCRNYIDFEEDCNCVLVAVYKSGPMTLEETGKRIDLSYARVKQIQDEAIKKIEEEYDIDLEEKIKNQKKVP